MKQSTTRIRGFIFIPWIKHAELAFTTWVIILPYASNLNRECQKNIIGLEE